MVYFAPVSQDDSFFLVPWWVFKSNSATRVISHDMMKGFTEISGSITLLLSPVVVIIFCDTFLNQVESLRLVYNLAGSEDAVFS